MSAPGGRRRRALLALGAFLVGGAGCERRAAESRPPAAALARPTDSLARPAALATPTADTTGALPAAVRAACADLHGVLAPLGRRNGWEKALVGPRDTVMTFGGFSDAPVEPACHLQWSDSANSFSANDFLGGAAARGWKERPTLLSADGPEGTVLAISHAGAACVFEMRWEGDDDSDSTYVPAPGFTAAVSCFTDRPDRY